MPTLRPAPGTGKWWALGIAFTVLFIAFASWRVLGVAAEQVDADTTAFHAIDDRTFQLSFDVHKPTALTVVCTLQAQDLKKNVVGTATLTVPPAPERTTTHTVTIRTTTKAFAGIVHDCVRTP